MESLDANKGFDRAFFQVIGDVQRWVDRRGGGDAGELALRQELIDIRHDKSDTSKLIQEWLVQQEHKRAVARAEQSLEIDRWAAESAQRSAVASERAARYAMWSALISATVGVLSAAAYWLSRAPG